MLKTTPDNKRISIFQKRNINIMILLLLLWNPVQAKQQTFTVNDLSWQLNVPNGYRVELVATMVKPRMLTVAEDGALLIGSLTENIYRLPFPYDKVETFARFWNGNNHGIAIRDGIVWVARSEAIYQIPYKLRPTAYTSEDFTLVAKLPSRNGGHSSRTIKISPDEKVYVSIGISGNCSDEYIGPDYDFEDRRGGILKLNEAPHPIWEPYATGLRNPVGFAWHPVTGVIYLSNNGPDHLGYEYPAEYFSRATADSFHGMPWFWFDGKKIIRDECIRSNPPRTDITLPEVTFPARNAPMDVAFIPPNALEKTWENDAIVALHGSWATQPKGRFFGEAASRRPPWIARVLFDKDMPIKAVSLIDGFQNDNGRRLARPIGLIFSTDGTLYFTSDGGAIEGLFRLRKTPSPPSDSLLKNDK